MLRTTLLAAGAALLAAAAPAQTSISPAAPGGQLIGFTSDGPSSPSISPPRIQRQTLCLPSAAACPTGMAPAAAPWAGGAAYNAITRGVWHTQGTRMAEVRIDDCQLLCSTAAQLSLGNGSLATGLAICESRLELYQLESIPGAAAMHVRHLRSCPLNVLRSCRFQLPTNRHIAGAIALDERRGLFFYATSIFGPTTVAGPQNVVLVARYGDPCNIACRFEVEACGNARLGPITAMTYDACSSLLYVSDGRQTVVLRDDPTGAAPCSFRPVRCCAPSPSRQSWHGFDIESSHGRQVGRSCYPSICRTCPNTQLVNVGDAAIGNPFHAFRVEGGQPGAIAALAIGVGPCVNPGAQVLCGFWHVGGPFFLPGQTLAGSGTCDGAATWAFPIPYIWELCDITLCAQAVTVCQGPGGFGLGLTNALQVGFSN